MPDISLCPGTSCNLKENCYRYLANPKPYWQSYFTSAPIEEEDGTCKYFWNYKESKEELKQGTHKEEDD